jgi:hypothetical protein
LALPVAEFDCATAMFMAGKWVNQPKRIDTRK